MNYAIDVKKESKRSETRFVLGIISPILFAAITFGGSILLLVFSNIHYVPNLLCAIFLSALGALGLAFYFLNVFPLLAYYRNFYQGLNKSTLETRRAVVYEGEKEEKTLHQVQHRNLSFSYQERQKTYHENLYVLDNPELRFQEGDVLRLATYRNVIVRYEVIGHADHQ